MGPRRAKKNVGGWSGAAIQMPNTGPQDLVAPDEQIFMDNK